MRICIDPGHTGSNCRYSDPGAVGLFGTRESDIALSIGENVKVELQANNLEVIMTRENEMALGANEASDLQARCILANVNNVDFYVSIHCNSSDNPSANGTETYCYKFGGEGQKLATSVQNRMNNEVGLYNRGVKEGNFAVLRNTDMPAILVETAFISNPHEEQLLNDPGFQKTVAKAIAGGICDYLGITYVPYVEPQPIMEQQPVADLQPPHWAKVDNDELLQAGILTSDHTGTLDDPATEGMVLHLINIMRKAGK